MGTFHDNLGPLHGITVAVTTHDNRTIVGRCHDANDHHVILLDAAAHPDTSPNLTAQDFLRNAARWGVFPQHRSLTLPAHSISSITPLNQLAL